jgi:type I restriction enzyme M protein
MSEENKKQLESQLWNIANELRGKMDADEFRDYILGFIFYKYLSEKMNIYANNLLKEDNISFKQIDENSSSGKEYLDIIEKEAIETLGYFLKPNQLFSSIVQGNKVSIEELEKTLNNIESSTMGSESEDDFGNLFEDLDLNSTKLGKTVDTREDLITKVIGHLDKIDFEIENIDSDVLGDAYEYLIAQFASGAGKKAGEFYTPQEVSKVLAKIVTTGKERLKNVYDPTCGSGSLLLRVAKEVKDVSQFYGQELNRTTYNLARMNMIMHDVHYQKFDIKQEDTLEKPQHVDMKFEAIVANPPFSAQWSANPLFMSDERFSQYGKLAPKSKADYAFLTHMVHHLDDNGTLACVLPHGALFRGAAEGHIREFIIKEKNYLDAVIGLPANIFYGTSIPTCIIVLKKYRQSNDVLFIDASQHYEKIKTQNYLREEDINKIISTYRERKTEDKYSYLASKEDLLENEFNLNIPRYVDTFEEDEKVDLDLASDSLSKINKQIEEINKSIEDLCYELKLKKPF